MDKPNAEMTSFLAGLHVAVIGIAAEGRGPITVPIWYAYEPGDVIKILTFSDSLKARLLKVGVRFSLCVQDEAPPYKFVTVEGPVLSVHTADLAQEIKPIVYRYLGQKEGDRYIRETYPDQNNPGELLIQMKPERWFAS